MAKLEKPSLWLGPSVPHIVKCEGEHGETKEFSFRLHLNFNALRTIELRTGIPLSDPRIFFKAQRLVQNQVIFFWAASLAYHPEYNSDEGLDFIGSILTYRNAGAANDAVYEAYLKALPEEAAAQIRKAVEEAAKAKAEGKEEENADPQTKAPAEN